MLKDGIIEEVQPGSNNDWSSALHLANKPGGGVRPCLDFRILNTKTITDSHPLPLLKDFTKKIHGSVMFSKVDLRSAFFNIPIWPAHKHKTLTLSPWGGSFAFNRLPFGLSSLQGLPHGRRCWNGSSRTWKMLLFTWMTSWSGARPRRLTMRPSEQYLRGLLTIKWCCHWRNVSLASLQWTT